MRPVTAYLAARQLSLSYFALKRNNFATTVKPKNTCKLKKLKLFFLSPINIAQYCAICIIWYFFKSSLGVSPGDHQAWVIHVISPISLKLGPIFCQFILLLNRYKLSHVKSLISFIHESYHYSYRERVSLRASERYGVKNESMKTTSGS